MIFDDEVCERNAGFVTDDSLWFPNRSERQWMSQMRMRSWRHSTAVNVPSHVNTLSVYGVVRYWSGVHIKWNFRRMMMIVANSFSVNHITAWSCTHSEFALTLLAFYLQCLFACIAYVVADVGNSRNQYLPPDKGYNYPQPQPSFGNIPSPQNVSNLYIITNPFTL